jgi:predicted DNA-binding ribbon-helix-helix protein
MRSDVGVGNMRSSTVAKRTIYLGGGRKRSVALEGAFWEGLNEIAQRRQMTVSKLVGEINAQRRHNNLSSAIRLYILKFYRSKIPDVADRESVTPPNSQGGGGGE